MARTEVGGINEHLSFVAHELFPLSRTDARRCLY
jgi:hypothetical protein